MDYMNVPQGPVCLLEAVPGNCSLLRPIIKTVILIVKVVLL